MEFIKVSEFSDIQKYDFVIIKAKFQSDDDKIKVFQIEEIDYISGIIHLSKKISFCFEDYLNKNSWIKEVYKVC